MNIKLALGIFLPLVLIIFLVILSSANISFSIDLQTTDSVQFNSLFIGKNTPRNNILIQTVTVSNDFFMSKRYELPRLIVCLNDKEGIKERQNLQVKYNEGTYSRGSEVPIFDEIFFDYRSYSRQSIELPAESKKQVKIFVEPKYLHDYEQEINSYDEYEELLLIESKENTRYSYNSCRNLESKELASAIHILIAK